MEKLTSSLFNLSGYLFRARLKQHRLRCLRRGRSPAMLLFSIINKVRISPWIQAMNHEHVCRRTSENTVDRWVVEKVA